MNDPFTSERIGRDDWRVYLLTSAGKVEYCRCTNFDTAALIALALNEHTARAAGEPGQPASVERITFADGSEIFIRVTGPDPQGNDQAGRAYRSSLYRPLMDIERPAGV